MRDGPQASYWTHPVHPDHHMIASFMVFLQCRIIIAKEKKAEKAAVLPPPLQLLLLHIRLPKLVWAMLHLQVATAGGVNKAAMLRRLGADRVVDYKQESLKV